MVNLFYLSLTPATRLFTNERNLTLLKGLTTTSLAPAFIALE